MRAQANSLTNLGASIVDMEPGFNGFHGGLADVVDGCHPNPQGEVKIATKFLNAMQLDGIRQVSCGKHSAGTCAECPQGHGADWCNGECMWKDSQCMAKDDGAGKVNCGRHIADTCESYPQGHGADWCNGDCTWTNGQCSS